MLNSKKLQQNSLHLAFEEPNILFAINNKGDKNKGQIHLLPSSRGLQGLTKTEYAYRQILFSRPE
jgi:hypothetical protein